MRKHICIANQRVALNHVGGIERQLEGHQETGEFVNSDLRGGHFGRPVFAKEAADGINALWIVAASHPASQIKLVNSIVGDASARKSPKSIPMVMNVQRVAWLRRGPLPHLPIDMSWWL